MSTNEDLGAEVIQHIDDACDEEYIEGFAPKAQEEILSENQACDSNKNIVDESSEKSEFVDLSNEEIHEASNELVKDVITDVESDINQEDEGVEANDEDGTEINAEIIDAEEADVVMTEREDIEVNDESNDAVELSHPEETAVDKPIGEDVDEPIVEAADEPIVEAVDEPIAEAEPILEETEDEPVIEETADEPVIEETADEPVIEETADEPVIEEKADEPIVEETSDEPVIEEATVESEESAPIVEEDEKIEDANEIIQEQLVENTEEVSHDVEISDATEITESDAQDVSENKSRIVGPPKGKDVKSLSTTYGHDDNITNGDCCICNKIVYPMEKLATNDRLFHKMCFRCTKCKNALSTGNFTFNQGKPYCTPHYVELFKKRGRYDEIDDSMEADNSTATDISDVITDELPAPDTTKNILAKFRDLEISGGNNTNQSAGIESSDELPAPNTTKNLMERFSALGQEKSEAKCKPKIDIPRHSNGHSNGTSENEPVVLSKDVIRSNEPTHDDKPEQGITKNLVNQFRKMESSANN